MLTIPFKPLSRKPKIQMTVCRAPGRVPHRGFLRVSGCVFPCSLGRSGISVFKREGDGATPAGSMAILGGYRSPAAWRFSPAIQFLKKTDGSLGWCDASGHPAYNRPVRLPFSASHERMLRSDRLYDICLVLDWKVTRRACNRGSAIFMHLTRPDSGPTQGCIAVDPKLMRGLLARLLKGAQILVKA